MTSLSPSFLYSLFIISLDITILCTQPNRMLQPYAMRLGFRALDGTSVQLDACSESDARSVGGKAIQSEAAQATTTRQHS